MDFQKDLRDSIFNSDEKIDREQLLEDIFKSFVAKMFEYVISRQGGDRLPFDSIVTVKNNLINEFRTASLGEYQKSEEWYDELFEKTIKEILQHAALAHKGENKVSYANQNLEINPAAYKHEKGLYLPN
jgi:hypothetical protein